jgi:hypothetical protein
MAGAGKKTFTAGEVLTASDVNTYLMEQSVMYFAGTAARSSAIPTPTTGMTTYIGVTGTATIPQLETYTGSAWQTPYGLTQVAKVDFTSATVVNIDNVFTSAYQNYQVLINISTASATSNHTLAYRASGAPNNTANYFYGAVAIVFGSATVQGSQAVGATIITEGSRADSGAPSFTNLYIANPQLAARTYSQAFTTDSSVTRQVGGLFNATTQFDGFALTPQSGNITGTIRVYGLRNS